ncbi:ABC transporter substrate-binding protein [Paracoccus aminophilus]|uniref:ABC-type dipeptide transport system, periplasmic component n=1 Tax=Paracoccus aminophilus JCM 7686 TaxID=1367847 RepID=S5XMD4_PARAH|nr:ABC transporter substrate-binding protein [Paracoccus aminophilus]AGT08459.1 ABC-type dipeptide transport system, periplasmic component [Paracoccus aminophilus JCM 7686]
MKLFPLSFAALATAALLALPVQAEPITLSWGIPAEASDILTANTTSGTAQLLGTKVFDGLLSYNDDLTPKPQLATVWDVSPDGLTYRFTLREGVKFHDGTPLTPQDVAFSINYLKANHPRGNVTFSTVERIETPDAHTVVLHLTKPTPFLLSALASAESPILPEHVFADVKPGLPPPDDKLIGTGPYRFVKWQRGDYIIFEKNPDYWDKGKPEVDRLVGRFITDAASRSAAFETGEIAFGEINPAEAQRFKDQPGFQVIELPKAYNGSHAQLAFNLDRELPRDIHVREAVSHAIDVPRILDTVYYGAGTVSPTPIIPSKGIYHDADLGPFDYDPKKAEAILDAAGYKPGPDGFRFKIELALNGYHDPRLGSFIQQSLREIGIDASLRLNDPAAYIKRVYTDRDFDFAIDFLGNYFDPAVGVQRVFWSKSIRPGVPFVNPSHYSNPEVDRLLEAAADEPDQAKRVELYRQFQEIIRKDLPVIDLLDPPTFYLVSDKVTGLFNSAQAQSGNFADLKLATPGKS